MWRITLLSTLRKIAFPKRRATSGCLTTESSSEEQRVKPMSDQELAVAIRQISAVRSKMMTPLNSAVLLE
jgi:hypothetical protein